MKVGIFGASGLSGIELLRLLANHPEFQVAWVSAQRSTGSLVSALYPHLESYKDLRFISLEDGLASCTDCDLVFSALPHGQAMQYLGQVRAKRIIDLSADFRLNSAESYKNWYAKEHTAPSELGSWTYGLSELNRAQIKKSAKVANPGCYATAIILAAAPLVKKGFVDSPLLVSAASGLSGAGNAPKSENLLALAEENVQTYKLGTHQHTAEIEQTLSAFCNSGSIKLTMIPQVVPMSRGIHVTLFADLKSGHTAQSIKDLFCEFYKNEPFVKVQDHAPGTKQVRGSNCAKLFVTVDHRTNKIVVVTVIDNLVKGAAGQALQNANLMCGFDETFGLSHQGLFP